MKKELFPCLFLLCAVSRIASTEPEDPDVPRFVVDDSPVTLRGDVRPHQFLSAIGRAAAWLGRETGEAEIWVHPFKLATDFRLSFRIPDYREAIRGADVARTVEARPELTTITYSHATFTVREHILAPLDEPGVLVLLDVETFRPLEIVVSFQTVFQHAWPGAFGGQYTFWNADEKVFVLSESLRERNAVIGSPWATEASTHPAHALPDAPSQFVIPVDPERIRTELIPVAMAASRAPRDQVVETYRRLIRNAASLYREKRAHVDRLLAETTGIDTPEDELDLALAWSAVNLDEAFCCNPDLGCGLVAGWGPSGSSTRPGFGWFFGGDAAINSLAMDSLGLWSSVAEGLRFLARYQREDGKIPHEISQASRHIPWFTDFPYAYYHADTTPYWIAAVWRYWRASGDDGFLRELWPALAKAFEWCRSTETDGDGIIENTSGGLGAIEVGQLGEGIHQDIYLAAVWLEALSATIEMADFMAEGDLAREAETLRGKAWTSLNESYWREDEGHHAFAILRSGGTNDNLTVWPATAAAFGLLDSGRAAKTLIHLARDRVSADWGAHILSTKSPLYDPTHYNNGAVWPFVTGFVTWGQYRYRRPWAGYPLIQALAQMTFDWARGRHPELLSGRFYRPLDTAVPQQFFATSMLVSSVLQGMLGWEPDAPRSRARLTPQLPPQWEQLVVRNLRVGDTSIDLTFEQGMNQAGAEIKGRGSGIDLEISWPLPPGARNVETKPPAEVDAERIVWTLAVSDESRRVETRWSGGLRVEPPVMDLVPGQASLGVRVLDFRFEDEAWVADLEGMAGKTYELTFRGEKISRVDGARLVAHGEGVSTVAVEFPPGPERTDQRIRLER